MFKLENMLATAGISVVALIIAAPALAQDAPSVTKEEKETAAELGEEQGSTVLDTIIIDSNVDNGAVYSAPASSVYLSTEQLDRFGRISAGDMLKTIPGVQVGDSRNGGGVDVNIRGIQGQSRVAVTVDGSQQALDVYRGYNGTQQRSYIDQDLIRDMVVSKGPALDASTPSGIGGSVRMETWRAEDVILPGNKWGVRLKGEMWDNGLNPPNRSTEFQPASNLAFQPRTDNNTFLHTHAKSGSGVFAIDLGNIDLVAGFAKRNQGNYVAGRNGYEQYRVFDKWGYERSSVAKSYKPGEEVLNSSARSDSLLLKGTLKFDTDHQLELTYRGYDGHFGEIMPSSIFRTSTAGIHQYPEGSMAIDSATARYKFNPSDKDWLNVTANLWWTGAKSSQLNDVNGPVSQRFTSDRSWVRVENNRFGSDIANSSDFATSVGDFSLKLAGGFQYEDIRPQSAVVISEHDRNMNRIIREGSRLETNFSAQLDYKPLDTLTLWGSAKFTSFRSDDRNTHATAIRERQKGRFINVWTPDFSFWGNMFWRPDANGNYTDATDPRKNNGIVWTNSNNPFEGIHFDDLQGVNVSERPENEANMVVGFSHSKKLTAKDHAFAPSIGLNYEILPETFLYTRYSQAMRMPSLFETTHGTLQVRLKEDHELKPERMQALEIGASTSLSGVFSEADVFSAKISYFHNNIKNFIVRIYDPKSDGTMEMRNAKSYETKGIEFQSNYDMGRLFVDLSATYYLETRTCDPTFAAHLRTTANRFNPTENTPDCTPGGFKGSYVNTQNPPHLATNLTIGGRFFDEKLVVGSRLTYTSGPTVEIKEAWQISDTTPQLFYHPVTLVDAFLGYQFSNHAAVNASITNIMDRYYLDPLAQSFMAAPGRTFRLGFSAQF